MASLISWLADAGARKSDGTPVASGKVWFYQPGTTGTQVTVFSDADGLYPLTQPVALDAGGRAVVFATQAVQPVIQDSTGATVRSHDRGNTVTAAQVEIQNSVATGTDLTTGAQATGGRTDLDTFLTNLRASHGAVDGLVDMGSIGTKALKDAIRSLSHVFDVTTVPYGAKGDGVTDDTTAIQAAITAANAAGGGTVVFPPGTYIVTSLTIPSNLTLLGAGSGRSIVQSSYATEVLLVATGALVAQGIKFKSTGKGLLRYTVAIPTGAVFTACAFELGSANTVVGIVGDVGGGVLNLSTFLGCDFVRSGSGATQAFLGTGCRLFGGTVTLSNSWLFDDNTFNVLGGVYVEYQGSTNVTLVRNAASIYPITLVASAFAGTGLGVLQIANGFLVREFGCDFVINALPTSALLTSSTRESQYASSSGSATSYTPDFNQYRSFFVTSSGASFQWNNPTVTGANGGQRVTLWYKNTNAGAITPTLDTAYKGAPVAVASGSACGMFFEYQSALGKWVQIGSTVAYSS